MIDVNLSKRIIVSAIGSLLLVGSVSPAFALGNGYGSMKMENTKSVMMDGGTMTPHVSGMPNAAKQAARMDALKLRASNEIDRRVASLNEVITKVNGIMRLSSAQKSSFVSGIQTEITTLTTLKTKIAADTDTVTLRADVQSIVQSYRVYALYIPQIRILIAADMLGTTADNFTAYVGKLQTRITEAKTAGNDVTSLQTSLADMQQKITDAQTQIQNAIVAVVSLTPSGYPGNKTSLQSGRTMLETARKDLQAAWQDARTIMQGLRAMKHVKPSGAVTQPVSSTSANQ